MQKSLREGWEQPDQAPALTQSFPCPRAFLGNEDSGIIQKVLLRLSNLFFRYGLSDLRIKVIKSMNSELVLQRPKFQNSWHKELFLKMSVQDISPLAAEQFLGAHTLR